MLQDSINPLPLRQAQGHPVPHQVGLRHAVQEEQRRAFAADAAMDRRIANLSVLQREVLAWERERNRKTGGVDWQFTTPNARIKLRHLYPLIKR